MKHVATFGVLALLCVASSASALVITGGPVTSLPGGGSCTMPAPGTIIAPGGGNVLCTGVSLAAPHTHVYFGIDNVTGGGFNPNGNTMTNADPTAGSSAVFRYSSNTANSITYTSTTTVADQIHGTQTVTSQLVLTLTVGTGSVVLTSGTPGGANGSSGNGDVGAVFSILGGSSFTVNVQINASDPFIGNTNARDAFAAAHSVNFGGTGERSKVAVGFYYSDCNDGQLDSALPSLSQEVCDDGGSNGTSASCCTTSCTFQSNIFVCTGTATTCAAASGTCSGTSNACTRYFSSSTVCRAAVSNCDITENCTGTNENCPADSIQPSSTVCRAAAGFCDIAENCTGTSTVCPADSLKVNGTVCRAAVSNCDITETCTGTNTDCPPNALQPPSTVCRAAVSNCDIAENCTGTSTVCPGDTIQPSTTVCRAAAGACDITENCTGTSTTCPGDAIIANGQRCTGTGPGNGVDCRLCNGVSTACTATKAPNGTVCRASGGACDVAEFCDGVVNACPSDTKRPSSFECRASSGGCDPAEFCTGSTNTCPGDTISPNGTICRAAQSVCDIAETCNGVSTACPADAVNTDTSTVCRAFVPGGCDIAAENCTGTSATCPPDTVQPANTVCRPASGLCDAQEVCSGTSNACPADALLPANTSCRPAVDFCDAAEVCTGTDPACPPDAKQPSTLLCRAVAPSSNCDVAEFCTGSDDACPADGFAATTVNCRASTGVCDPEEYCTGTNAFCPPDLHVPAGTVCRAAVSVCDVDEVCDGTHGPCPNDVFANNTTVCRAAADVCDKPEFCPGTSSVCPIDKFKLSSVQCRAVAGPCDIAENCTGSDAACPTDTFKASTVTCRASACPSNPTCCDLVEKCTGSDAACPPDAFLDSTTVCRAQNGVCDVEETCTGTQAFCPSDSFAPSTQECRASAGQCDVAENCTGTNRNCPLDHLQPNGTVCTDNSVCTDGDHCQNGTCVPGPALPCQPWETCDAINGCNGPTWTPTPVPPTATPSPTSIGPNCTDTDSPHNPCSPGGGPKRTDCNIEWQLYPPIPPIGGLNQQLVPPHRRVCYEGDPTCDTDPDLANHSCTFGTMICANNADPRLTTCLPSDFKSLTIMSPRDNATNPVDQANLQAMSVASAFSFGFNNEDVTPLHYRVLYALNGAPTPSPVPFTIPNRCSYLIPIQVPLKLTVTNRERSSRRTLRVKATTSALTTDTDSLTLICRPSTCGDGIIQLDHETCDDGNRINGDGCDQACQIEGSTPTPTGTFFTRTPTPSESPRPSPTPTLSPTPTDTPTETPTFTPTETPTDTPTLTPTETPTVTATFTPTETLVPGQNTRTNTPTPTRTPTPTITPTGTNTPTFTPTRTGTSTRTPTNTLTPTPTITPTFISRTCNLGAGTSATISARLVVLGLGLSGSQQWQFGYLKPDGTRDLNIPPSGSHFNCAQTTFSGVNVKICARLDPSNRCQGGPNFKELCSSSGDCAGFPCGQIPGSGVVDCSGGHLTGYNSNTQIDHNTNATTVGGQPNIGLPSDPSCTHTFTNPDGSVSESCLEGSGAECSGTANAHVGACNSPVVQVFSDSYPANGFKLHENIIIAFGINEDCGSGCPADSTPLQSGELAVEGDISSGRSQGIVWQVNNTALIMGTTGVNQNGAPICGTLSGGPNCVTVSNGGTMPAPPTGPNCASIGTVSGCTGPGTPFGCCTGLNAGTCNSIPSSLAGAAVSLSYPAIDLDPTIGDFVASLRLQCN